MTLSVVRLDKPEHLPDSRSMLTCGRIGPVVEGDNGRRIRGTYVVIARADGTLGGVGSRIRYNGGR